MPLTPRIPRHPFPQPSPPPLLPAKALNLSAPTATMGAWNAELGVLNVMRPLPCVSGAKVVASFSISAGQMVFFSGDSLAVCLRERGSAIRLLREDLLNSEAISPVSVLTVFLLGMSASWIEPRPDSWGKEHMDGARALIKLILVDKKARQDSTTQLLAGWYLWWDMTCAFLDDDTCDSPDQCITQNMLSLEQDHPSFHPIIGDSFELYAMVADIGRVL
ncbi:C6 zinc finger domain-containing protein [Fusarium bulbicola]|nr:C6 zinc finger domain-containing protein [Fusarium bulbicola]